MDLLQDVGSAVRRLAGQRGFTLGALLTLALGIGANTAMFSIVYGLLLRPLPYPDAESLVRVWESMGGSGGQMLSNRSMPVLEDAGSFEQLAAYRESSVEWASPEGTVTLRGAAVSPALFPLLRAVPQLGRLFTDGEAREGADRDSSPPQRSRTERTRHGRGATRRDERAGRTRAGPARRRDLEHGRGLIRSSGS